MADREAEDSVVRGPAKRFGIRASLLTSWRRRHVRGRMSRKATQFAARRVNAAARADGTVESDQANRPVRVHGRVDAGMLREGVLKGRR